MNTEQLKQVQKTAFAIKSIKDKCQSRAVKDGDQANIEYFMFDEKGQEVVLHSESYKLDKVLKQINELNDQITSLPVETEVRMNRIREAKEKLEEVRDTITEK